MNLTQIPTTELIADYAESDADIQVCATALEHGVDTYSGGSTRDRLETNNEIMRRISIELVKRGYELTNGV